MIKTTQKLSVKMRCLNYLAFVKDDACSKGRDFIARLQKNLAEEYLHKMAL